MKPILKIVLTLILGLNGVLFGSVQSFAALLPSSLNYVALGDSLAAGQTPFGEIDKGYADFIADYLKEKQETSFTKSFAEIGSTSQNVLDDISNNKMVDDIQIQEMIRGANILTLSVGANDLLNEATVEPDGTIGIDPAKVPVILSEFQENLTMVLETIKALNADVKIYISGYYFPFPYLPDDQQPELQMILSLLNNTIQNTVVEQGASFVSLDTVFIDNPTYFIPNPEEIYPTVEGYERIAEKFIQVLQ